MKFRIAGLACAFALAPFAAAPAHAQLNMICSMQVEPCQGMINAFEKQTGIKVSATNKSSGETFAQINAEKENPKTDIWVAGTGDPHLQAADTCRDRARSPSPRRRLARATGTRPG